MDGMTLSQVTSLQPTETGIIPAPGFWEIFLMSRGSSGRRHGLFLSMARYMIVEFDVDIDTEP